MEVSAWEIAQDVREKNPKSHEIWETPSPGVCRDWSARKSGVPDWVTLVKPGNTIYIYINSDQIPNAPCCWLANIHSLSCLNLGTYSSSMEYVSRWEWNQHHAPYEYQETMLVANTTFRLGLSPNLSGVMVTPIPGESSSHLLSKESSPNQHVHHMPQRYPLVNVYIAMEIPNLHGKTMENSLFRQDHIQ